jgi:coenzyme F420-0:L-glutamate ligase/coenzyme F420-1:gamma-L-glutamate ligase
MILTLTPLPDIPVIETGVDLAEVILTALQKAKITLISGDILVLAQKIVSKAEGRLVPLNQVIPSGEAIELAGQSEKDPREVELVLRESNEVLRIRPGVIIVEHKLGFVCANAGIDRSNTTTPRGDQGESVLLLPENPSGSAAALRSRLETASGAQLGVLVIDSHGRAWRFGTLGLAIGLSGVPGVEDLRGHPDMFGYKLQSTEVGTADELAAAASLMMGQADEGTPVVHVRGFPYPLREGTLGELLRPKEQDLFR